MQQFLRQVYRLDVQLTWDFLGLVGRAGMATGEGGLNFLSKTFFSQKSSETRLATEDSFRKFNKKFHHNGMSRNVLGAHKTQIFVSFKF
jgi:hypothetical protein